MEKPLAEFDPEIAEIMVSTLGDNLVLSDG